MTLPLSDVRALVARSMVVIHNSHLSGTSIGGHMAGTNDEAEQQGRTKVAITQSTVKDTEVAGASDVAVDRSKVTGLKVGDARAFLGIPVRVWVGTAGGMGLIGLVAYVIGQWLNRAR